MHSSSCDRKCWGHAETAAVACFCDKKLLYCHFFCQYRLIKRVAINCCKSLELGNMN